MPCRASCRFTCSRAVFTAGQLAVVSCSEWLLHLKSAVCSLQFRVLALQCKISQHKQRIAGIGVCSETQYQAGGRDAYTIHIRDMLSAV